MYTNVLTLTLAIQICNQGILLYLNVPTFPEVFNAEFAKKNDGYNQNSE